MAQKTYKINIKKTKVILDYMKICFISFTYYPNLDGVQNVTAYQAEGLVRLGHEVTVITSQINGYPDSDMLNGVNIIRLPIWKYGLWSKGNKQFVKKRFLNICNEHDVVIDVCYFDFLSQNFIPLLPKLKCKKMCMMHGTWEYEYTQLDKTSLKTFVRKTFQNLRWKIFFYNNRKNYMRFDGIFHLHENDKSIQYSKKIGFTKDYVLVNAVDESFFLQKRNYEKKDLPFIFIQVANYSFRKNQILALRAFYQANLPNSELWMIGSQVNDYYNFLIKENERLSKNKQSKVKIFVELDRKETIEKISKADISILSSISEHLPVTILEGLAAGLPFISTDVGVVSSIPGGIVCKTESDLSLAMIKLYEDNILRKQLAEIGFSYANKNCHINEQVKKMEKIIYEL